MTMTLKVGTDCSGIESPIQALKIKLTQINPSFKKGLFA